MDAILAWLNQPVISFLGNPLSHEEVFGFATGLWCVWLTARRSIWNFPVGIANCALLFLLFWQGRLFADASLQIIFICLGLYGWLQWARGRVGDHIPVSRLAKGGLATSCATGAILTAGLFMALTLAKGSVPLFDAAITALSLVAQYLLNQRRLESWYFWIAVDVISIPVYVHKELYLIALLYAVFLVMCVIGHRAWQRDLFVGAPTTDADERAIA